MKVISFVLPVYRNERAVTLTYQQIRKVMASDLQRYGYEIVFVDDGSDDGSPAELAAIRAADERVRLVTFTRNFGQMAAILAGLRQASGDVIIQLSADLQDPIALVPQMVAEYERGSEVVACHREHREDQWSRRVTSRALYAILRLSLPQIPAAKSSTPSMRLTSATAFSRATSSGSATRRRSFPTPGRSGRSAGRNTPFPRS